MGIRNGQICEVSEGQSTLLSDGLDKGGSMKDGMNPSSLGRLLSFKSSYLVRDGDVGFTPRGLKNSYKESGQEEERKVLWLVCGDWCLQLK